MTAAYRKIIHLPRPASGRTPMAVERRAKQFAPFAALKGFEDAVREKEIIYEPRRILSEERKNELDMKLRMLKRGYGDPGGVFYRESAASWIWKISYSERGCCFF